MHIKNLSALPAVLLFSACALGPSAAVDATGLGNHTVAQEVRYALFLGEETVNRAVGRLVNTPEILGRDDPRPRLRGLGFDCAPLPAASCTYEGSATSILRSPDRPGDTRLTTHVDIRVMLDNKPFAVASRIRRENF